MQASSNDHPQRSHPAPHGALQQRPLLAGLLVAAALACAPHSAQAFNFDDLEKVEKVERGERKVRDARAEAARREEEARRQAQQQADEAARQRAASSGGQSGGSSSAGRQVDRSKFILIPDGNRYKLHCGSRDITGFVTFINRHGNDLWGSTWSAGLDTLDKIAYAAAEKSANCWR